MREMLEIARSRDNPRGSARRANRRAPRAAAQIDAAHRDRLLRLSQSCHVRLNARSSSRDAGRASSSRSSSASARGRARELARVAQDADVVPHQVVERLAHRPRGLPAGCPSGSRGARAAPPRAPRRSGSRQLPCVARPARPSRRPRCRRTRSSWRRRCRRAGSRRARRRCPRPRRKGPGSAVRAVGVELDAAHHVVRGRHDFDEAAREIEAAVGAALDHALELLARRSSGPRWRHRDVDAAVAAWRGPRASRRRSRATRCRASRARRAGRSRCMKRSPSPFSR